MAGAGQTPLPDWICDAAIKKALILDEEVQDLFDQVLSCYGMCLPRLWPFIAHRG
jgi:hypothetical protein